MKILTIAMSLVLTGSLHASGPGEPLTCEDVQMSIAGLTVRTWISAGPPCCGPNSAFPGSTTVDLESYLYSGLLDGGALTCGSSSMPRQTITRFRDDVPETLVATLESRCVDPDTGQIDRGELEAGAFDYQKGRLYLRLTSNSVGPTQLYEDQSSLCAIEGLKRLSDFYRIRRR
jgi:hypothetical protein